MSRAFHSTPQTLNRIPALQVRISRNSWERNQKRIAKLKNRLGDKYAEIGRDKRRSPTTEKRSSTSESQVPRKPEPQVKLRPFLAGGNLGGPKPLGVVAGSLDDTMESVKGIKNVDDLGEKVVQKVVNTTGSLRMPTKQGEAEATISAVLELPPNAIPEVTTSDTEAPYPFSTAATAGPYYSYGLTPSELELLLKDVPEAMERGPQSSGSVGSDAQAEIVRRIVSLDMATQKMVNKWNVARCVSVFGRRAGDTGSPEVQAAVLTIKIQAMLHHLRNPSNPHRKDISTKRRLEHIVSQRMKMLKYLRRTDLERFVKTCQAIGVEPDSIRV
ncbi:ribosomal protein S15 [Gaertneriomyces sp. JEL0708]|nr:ribosomal protein S15 [Gaertneriomyces sp. JEL0708]